tara:strand:- start:54 stop:515 length:462 start_codon:yes stop_codon:yes gene_type:complete
MKTYNFFEIKNHSQDTYKECVYHVFNLLSEQYGHIPEYDGFLLLPETEGFFVADLNGDDFAECILKQPDETTCKQMINSLSTGFPEYLPVKTGNTIQAIPVGSILSRSKSGYSYGCIVDSYQNFRHEHVWGCYPASAGEVLDKWFYLGEGELL